MHHPIKDGSHSPRAFTSPRDDEDLRIRAVESLRWFDYWLKGIDTGVLAEDPIHYAVQQGHPYWEGSDSNIDQWTWRSSEHWPLDGFSDRELYLETGPSATAGSSNDGKLSLHRQSSDHTWQGRTIDDNVTTGLRNRMGAAFVGAAVDYPDMRENDARGLTWTSEPLGNDLVIGGVPRLHLVARASVPDANLIVWLEEIDEDGRSCLITYGSMRLSHRQSGSAPFDSAGIPYNASTKSEVAPVHASEPLELSLALHPVANRFARGHRLRVTVVGSDVGNLEPMKLAGEASLEIKLDESRLVLPVEAGLSQPLI